MPEEGGGVAALPGNEQAGGAGWGSGQGHRWHLAIDKEIPGGGWSSPGGIGHAGRDGVASLGQGGGCRDKARGGYRRAAGVLQPPIQQELQAVGINRPPLIV